MHPEGSDAASLRHWIRYWLVPKGVARVLRQTRWRLGEPKDAELLERNAKWVAAHRDVPAFVVANGPSLRLFDLPVLEGQVSFGMNWLNQHSAVGSWQPMYYCAAEPGGNLRTSQVRGLLARIEPQAYFMRTDMRPHVVALDREHDTRFNFYRSGVTLDEWSPRRLRLDPTKTMPGFMDTSQLALALAIMMGCSPIYLLGVDQNMLAHRGHHQHFYETGEPEDYIQPARQDLGAEPYLAHLRRAVRSWTIFTRLGQFAAERGQQVLNATPDSFLDMFPFVGPETLLNGRLVGADHGA